MYGLVNKAVEDLITTKFGTQAWEEITKKAGVDDIGFISMDPYPDEITYGLVTAAAEILEKPVDQLLEAFGEYWTLYTAREGYGDLMSISGENFEGFLDNLDSLHTRIALSFPELRPPTFACERSDDGDLVLHYHSERAGLAPMVRGLVKGLANMFEVEVDIQQTASKADGQDHDVFVIRQQQRA
jgi:Haem-NO-binding